MDFDRTQLLKGTLEGCILSIVRRHESYGYDIVSRLRACGFPEMAEGTVYPLLLRLERKAYVQADYRPSPLGPSRKYYRLTEEGEKALALFIKNWSLTAESVNQILEEHRDDVL